MHADRAAQKELLKKHTAFAGETWRSPTLPRKKEAADLQGEVLETAADKEELE